MVITTMVFTTRKQCNKEKTYIRVKVFDTLNFFRNKNMSFL